MVNKTQPCCKKVVVQADQCLKDWYEIVTKVYEAVTVQVNKYNKVDQKYVPMILPSE